MNKDTIRISTKYVDCQLLKGVVKLVCLKMGPEIGLLDYLHTLIHHFSRD